jgi:hypothetical protein
VIRPDPAMQERDFDEVPPIAELRGYMERILAKEESFLPSLTAEEDPWATATARYR